MVNTRKNNDINYFDHNNEFLLKRLILMRLIYFLYDRPLYVVLFMNIIR